MACLPTTAASDEIPNARSRRFFAGYVNPDWMLSAVTRRWWISSPT